MSSKRRLFILANAITRGDLLSGSDRIFLECAKRWRGIFDIAVITNRQGLRMCQAQGLDDVEIQVLEPGPFETTSLFFLYTALTIQALVRFSFSKIEDGFVYSSSDFLPDSIPALVKKVWNPKTRWIAGFFLFAPAPLRKDSPYKGKRFWTGLLYWLTQLPVYWLVKRFADVIFVTSEPDIAKFAGRKVERHVIAVHGGVDLRPSRVYLDSDQVIPVTERKYDACFVGRFHPQKGVLELCDIWRIVCVKKPNAKLAMIGDGALIGEVAEKIRRLGLQSNVELLGFKDGDDKYAVFKQSKLVVHPAVYDSGGMAACEAMAWGLPGVSFDLEALKTYYPKGMLKAACYNLEDFANRVLLLLEDRDLYARTSGQAVDWAMEWDWDKRANAIAEAIEGTA